MKRLLPIILSICLLSIQAAKADLQTSADLNRQLNTRKLFFTNQISRISKEIDNKCQTQTTNRCTLLKDRLENLQRSSNRTLKIMEARVGKLVRRETSKLQIIRNEILSFTNKERAKVGLNPLKYNQTLEFVAQSHSKDMATRNYFSHENPEKLMPQDRIEKAGYFDHAKKCKCDASWASGENIAMVENVNPTGKLYVELWMDSPGHRENIVRPDFEEIGIGFSNNYATQNFGRVTIGTNTPPIPTFTYGEEEDKERDTGSFTSEDDYTDAIYFALSHINYLRKEYHQPELRLNPLLNEIARRHSEDMAKKLEKMSHDGSLGETAADRIKKGEVPDTATGSLIRIPFPADIGWSGENVGMRNIKNYSSLSPPPDKGELGGVKDAIISQHEWFLAEPENEPNHRTTMLSTLYPFSEIGIGLYLDKTGNLWITEDYISILESTKP